MGPISKYTYIVRIWMEYKIQAAIASSKKDGLEVKDTMENSTRSLTIVLIT